MGLQYFPDANVISLERDPLRLLVTSKFSTYLVECEDMRSLDRAVEVLAPGGSGSFDNGDAGVGGVYHHHDGRLYAFGHPEGHDDMPMLAGPIFAFYRKVGLEELLDLLEMIGAVHGLGLGGDQILEDAPERALEVEVRCPLGVLERPRG